MGEKSKNAVIEIIKSDSVREYLEELLSQQTEEIKDSLSSIKEQIWTEHLNEELLQEKNKISMLERQLKELQISNEYYKQLLDEKQKECDIKSVKVTDIERQFKDTEKEKERNKLEYIEKEQFYTEQIQKLEEEKANLAEKNGEYEEKYSMIESAYLAYHALSENMKERIRNIFKDGNIYSMIGAAKDWANIVGMWDFVQKRIIEEENIEDIDNLKKMYRFIFEAYSQMNSKVQYELIEPKPGEKYDSDQHSICGVKTDGKIEKVLLEGICDGKMKTIVRKAFVKVQ